MQRTNDLQTFALAALVALGTLLPSPAQASEVQFKKNHIRFGGHRYFVRAASSLTLGSYGLKKTPVTEANYVSKASDVSVAAPESGGTYSATFSSDSAIGHQGQVALPLELVDLGISTAAFKEAMREGACTFEHLHLSQDQAQQAIENNRRAFDRFRDSDQFRIVYDVLRVKSCVVKTSRAAGGKAAGNVKVPPYVKVKGNDGARSQSEVTFAYGPKTIMGYRLLKAKWDKKRKKKRTKIVRMEDDNQGVN
ncbi:MAG: hypothetical protein AAFU79_35030 [Myxococcota bacterium]